VDAAFRETIDLIRGEKSERNSRIARGGDDALHFAAMLLRHRDVVDLARIGANRLEHRIDAVDEQARQSIAVRASESPSCLPR